MMLVSGCRRDSILSRFELVEGRLRGLLGCGEPGECQTRLYILGDAPGRETT